MNDVECVRCSACVVSCPMRVLSFGALSGPGPGQCRLQKRRPLRIFRLGKRPASHARHDAVRTAFRRCARAAGDSLLVKSPIPPRSGLVSLFLLSSVTSLPTARPPVHPWLFLLGAGGMFASMIFLSRRWPEGKSLALPLGIALLVRMLFIAFFPACDDVNRYIWEGQDPEPRVQPVCHFPRFSANNDHAGRRMAGDQSQGNSDRGYRALWRNFCSVVPPPLLRALRVSNCSSRYSTSRYCSCCCSWCAESNFRPATRCSMP